MAGIIRILLYAILAYVVLSIIKGIAASFAPRTPRPPRSSLPDALVKDEVCGTFLPRREAIRDIIDGRECFFCSQECRTKAKAGGRANRE